MCARIFVTSETISIVAQQLSDHKLIYKENLLTACKLVGGEVGMRCLWETTEFQSLLIYNRD